MLIGLAAKNAILIVEFAKDELEKGKPLMDAALEGARLRLRPILMTSFAFILGCVPLWIATGAGAVSRQIMGTTVIGGMLAASFIGIFIIPSAFYIVEKISGSAALAQDSRDCAAALAGARGLIPCAENSVCALSPLSSAAVPWVQIISAPNSQRRRSSARRSRCLRQEAFSLADLKWFELFHDEQLQALIKTALVQNYDLRDRGGARGRSARQFGDHAVRSVSAIRRERWRRNQPALARWRHAHPAALLPRRIATSERRR